MPYTCYYNGLQLYYVLNAQGDVVRMVDGNGISYGIYIYDAWGNLLYETNNVYTRNNPLRYRGYVYDEETGLYYCNSRYYDPSVGRFINADGLVSTGQGVLGNNMFAYCNNNPCNKADRNGCCSYFLSFKMDCFHASCPTSQCYNPDAPSIIVIYDGRASGKPFPSRDRGDDGFQHQGQELIRRLSSWGNVTGYSYTTMDDFISCWNSLDGSYDAIYILGHGQPGKFNAVGGSLTANNDKYNYTMLNSVDVSTIYLYICNGDTWPDGLPSTASNFSNLTGATVHAVRNGKLNFTWHLCHPCMDLQYFGEWTITTPTR